MRAVAVGAFVLLLVQGAAAQDALRGSSPILEGPAVAYDWSGTYGGAHASYVIGNTNFSNVSQPLLAQILRLTTLEDEAQVSSWPIIVNPQGARTTGYGGFVGFNSRWDEIVLGFEASYSRLNYRNTATGSLSRIITLSDDYQYSVTASTTSTVEITDLVTLKGRVGYSVGQWLPYVTAGLALARGNKSNSASVSYPLPDYAGTTIPQPPNPPAFSDSASENKSNILGYGYAFGAGVDLALLPNVFLRAEYEYTYLTNFSTGLNNGRVGIAVKF
jgi:opacity protein-like surface antigen